MRKFVSGQVMIVNSFGPDGYEMRDGIKLAGHANGVKRMYENSIIFYC